MCVAYLVEKIVVNNLQIICVFNNLRIACVLHDLQIT
jgi:hypothetical protein